eukprot:m.56095 g.56095  ORF g.56095 m.56095 type:complete len:75 (+) comp9291_c0_seq1:387-611(+)
MGARRAGQHQSLTTQRTATLLDRSVIDSEDDRGFPTDTRIGRCLQSQTLLQDGGLDISQTRPFNNVVFVYTHCD